MVALFPVPRTELPQVHVSDAEHRGRKAQLQLMLAALMAEYEHYTEGNSRQVDTRRWKSSASRDRLKLYKERSSYALNQARRGGEDPNSGVDPYALGRANSSTAFSEEGADNMRMSLVVGECAGRMENAMYAVTAATQSELAMTDIFLHEDVADCAILHTMEGPRPDDPYHFLGYKWFVRKSPTTSHLVKHRDSVYVECCGLTTTRAGDRVGYHIMHSVDLLDFPTMQSRNCLRAAQSIRTLYRQRPGNAVEVFILGNVGMSGNIKGPIATMFAHETLFNMPKLIVCGEAKRLADMVRDLQPLRAAHLQAKRYPGESCALCRHQKKRFGGAIDACHSCGLDVCVKCRISKRAFESDGVLGRFHKIVCCKTCLLVVANAKTHGHDLPNTDASNHGEASPSRPQRESPSTVTRSRVDSNDVRRTSSTAESAPPSPETDGHATQRILPLSRADPDEPSSRPRVLERTEPVGTGVSTTYRGQVIDISGSLGAINTDTTTTPPSIPPAAETVAPTPSSVSGFTTTYRSQVIDISGSLGLVQPPPAPTVAMQQVYEEPARTPPPAPVAQTGAGVTLTGSPSLRSSTSVSPSPPSAATSPGTQEDLYTKMLELQQKAKDAYNTTRQNQQFLTGLSP